MPHPFYLIDAFADAPFSGNPAAVVLLSAPAERRWMQAVAAEMKQAETAFVAPRAPGEWDLRWFTPRAEVDLCGHATLAAAHALAEQGLADGPVGFHTRSGRLEVRSHDGRLRMDFPATPVTLDSRPSAALAAALGRTPVITGRTTFDCLAELESEADVRALAPDLAAIARMAERGLIATARAEAGRPYAFVSRFFAPGLGVDEDSVTGSAHCALAPYWAERLSRTALVGYQASARGGLVGTEVRGARVILWGRARTVVRGTLHV
ncbi:MAG: PhzF family phenazine biosynthesis protein [Rubricoccaceae bacterium]